MTESRKPRILLWDIESAPLVGMTWRRYDTDLIRVVHDYHLLTVAWKWYGEKAVHVRGLPDFPLYKKDPHNDLELAKLAHGLFNKADIVVAHNGKEFDTKKARTRWGYHRLGPTTPIREVDTLKELRKHFSFTDNRLDGVCRTLGIGEKLETGGFATWEDCDFEVGNVAAWRRMKRYNRFDVVLLNGLYEFVLPYMTNHPNLAALSGRPDVCPTCGKNEGFVTRKYVYSGVSRRPVFWCKAHKGYVTGRQWERLDTEYVA